MKIECECMSIHSESIITVEDKGIKAKFINEDNFDYVLIQVDGCVVKEGRRADFVLRKNEVGDLIIELKRGNVEHALHQIEETAKLWSDNKISNKIAGLIVCTEVPRVPTKIQDAKRRFFKMFRSHLTIKTGVREYKFVDLFKA